MGVPVPSSPLNPTAGGCEAKKGARPYRALAAAMATTVGLVSLALCVRAEILGYAPPPLWAGLLGWAMMVLTGSHPMERFMALFKKNNTPK